MKNFLLKFDFSTFQPFLHPFDTAKSFTTSLNFLPEQKWIPKNCNFATSPPKESSHPHYKHRSCKKSLTLDFLPTFTFSSCLYEKLHFMYYNHPFCSFFILFGRWNCANSTIYNGRGKDGKNISISMEKFYWIIHALFSSGA